MSAADNRNRLLFFATPEHPCSYIPGRQATTLFADPGHPKDARLYSQLSHQGFRRSGRHIYRPRCRTCRACVPVRVPVAEFLPRRSQRRAWQANSDLRVRRLEARFRAEHFALYCSYINTRHPGGGMENPTPQDYVEFLISPWTETRFFEFRAGERLVAVAVADLLDDGLSAVYTFFDPKCAARSPGVFALLWEIEEARRLGLEWLYLGYWIAESSKMRYKREYQPQEHLVKGHWVRDTLAPG